MSTRKTVFSPKGTIMNTQEYIENFNPDAMCVDDLQHFLFLAESAPCFTNAQIAQLTGETEPVQAYRVLQGLCAYVRSKRSAMTHRSNGRIRIAMALEAQCEDVYQTLPQGARW